MEKISLSFVELHTPLFMQGVNLGAKINVLHRPVKLEYDLDRKFVLVHFKNKVAILPDSNVASMDVVDASQLGIEVKVEAPQAAKPVTSVGVDSVQSQLIEQARAAALGAKQGVVAQVSNPTKPVDGLTGITGKRKVMSHAELAKQVAAEKAES